MYFVRQHQQHDSAQADEDTCRSSSTLRDAHTSLHGYGDWLAATISCSQYMSLGARFLLALTGMPYIAVCNSDQIKMPETDLLASQSRVTVTS